MPYLAADHQISASFKSFSICNIAGGYIFICLQVRFMLFLVRSLCDYLYIPVRCQKPFVPQVYEFMNILFSYCDCCA